MDDDISVASDFLRSHIRAQNAWPGALITGAIELPAAALETAFGRFRHRLEHDALPAPGPVAAANFCAAGNLSVRRSDFLELRGFDEHLASGEDQDLALRHSKRGGPIAYWPEALGLHRDDALALEAYLARVEWGAQELIPFCQRHPEWPENRARWRVNGPLRSAPAPTEALRKLVKRCAVQAPFRGLLLGLAHLLERAVPKSALLDAVYRLLLGAHLLRGFRRGLERHGVPREWA